MNINRSQCTVLCMCTKNILYLSSSALNEDLLVVNIHENAVISSDVSPWPWP